MVISLVVPCYNEEAAIPYFYREIVKLAETMQNQEFEFIFIDCTGILGQYLAKTYLDKL